MATNDKEVSVPFLRKVTPWDKDGLPGVVQFKLANGVNVVFEMERASAANKERLGYHGASQKIGDSISGLIKDKLYKAAAEELQTKCDLMYSNDWSEKKVAGERFVDTKLLIAALMRRYNFDEAPVTLKVMEATEEERKQWASNSKTAAVMMQIKADWALEKAGDEEDDFTIDLPTEPTKGKK